MAERLARLSLVLKVLGSKHSLCTGYFKNSPSSPGYLALFRAEEGEGGE